MQSGYGAGVSEFQQFMMDGCSSPPLFSNSGQSPPPQPDLTAGALGPTTTPFRYQPLYHPLPHHHHHHHHPPQHPHIPPHFAPSGHFAGGGGHVPFTQQLLHQHHHQQFQFFHEQQHHHQQQSTHRSSHSTGSNTVPPFLAAAMSFKLAVDHNGSNTGGGGDEGMNGESIILHGDDETEESRFRRWTTGDDEAPIKEPTWRPLDIDYINSSSSNKSRPTAASKDNTPDSPPPPPANYFKNVDENAAATTNIATSTNPSAASSNNNYKLFSELEAIYKPGGSSTTSGNNGGGSGGNQTGSGSGLTGDDNAIILPSAAAAAAAMVDLGNAIDQMQHVGTSETSTGEEMAAAVQKPETGSANRSRKRKRRQQRRLLSAQAAFFERLVQQLMEHQEALHQKFLDAMERREHERATREESWRLQEAAMASQEAAARAQERALAASREAAVIAFLEKITGESIPIPLSTSTGTPEFQENVIGKELMNINDDGGIKMLQLNTSRWPKTEVEALIRVRTGLDERFQEPGLKGPLWDEVSGRMAAMGYRRSAKRCKEKWENINKYFRKAKESGKKRPAHGKTCPYFHELDQLYSKSGRPALPPPVVVDAGMATTSAVAHASDAVKVSSELLDAVVKCPDYSAIGLFGFDGDGSGRGNERTEEDGRTNDKDDGCDQYRDDDGEGGEGGGARRGEEEVESHEQEG